MKKILVTILCSLVCISSYATSNTSTGTKKQKATATTQSSDPILNAVAASKHNKKAKKQKNKSKKHPKLASNNNGQPKFYSYAAYIMDADSGKAISKNPTTQLPIASITKLMTAMVLIDSGVDLNEYVTIDEADIDYLRNTFSRLRVGMQLRRKDLLLLALMSSENRASFALARTAYPGGIKEFLVKMNAKAKSLGMTNTQFYDPTGLTAQNKATAIDLAKMVQAAFSYNLIREDTTTKSADVMLSSRYTHHYINSDALVRTSSFQIELSKTGFINEAGHCLVLYSIINNRPIVMIFLNSNGKSGRLVDAIAAKNYINKLQ